jgi:hypothetical protein
MSPFLESYTQLKNIRWVKYVTVGEKIYFSDEKNPMRILDEEHATLAEKAGVKDSDDRKRPLVEDGGIIYLIDGKVVFRDTTGSCKIKNPDSAKKITATLAKKILGEDKVA